jgi:hypothetical protein
MGIQVPATSAMDGHDGKPPRVEMKEAVAKPAARFAGGTPALHFLFCEKNLGARASRPLYGIFLRARDDEPCPEQGMFVVDRVHFCILPQGLGQK